MKPIEIKGNVKTVHHSIEGNVQSTPHLLTGNVRGALGVIAEWGKIGGDIDDQTDLIGMLNGKASVESQMISFPDEHGNLHPYPIHFMSDDWEIDGIKGLLIVCDDGTPEGKYIFLANGKGLTTVYQDVVGQIPTDNASLTNGAGYITGIDSTMINTALGFTPYSDENPSNFTSDSALTTTDIDEAIA